MTVGYVLSGFAEGWKLPGSWQEGEFARRGL